MKTRKLLHYINVSLSFLGILFSFYIIGWLNADGNIAVGSLCFIAFVGTMTLSTYNWIKSQKE